jgi:outer membrane protein, multidrug efflux system
MRPYITIKPAYLAVLIALVALNACTTVGPNYKRPASPLPEQYSESTTSNPAEKLNDWWTLYHDDALNALVEKANANNTNIQLAVARIEEADAQMREVGAALLPAVDLSAGANRNRVTGAGAFPVFGQNPRNSFSVALNSSIEIDFWGKIKRAKEAARANYLSTRFAKQTVMWSLSSLVAKQYLIIRSMDAQLALNVENHKISQESVALTNRRLEGGIVSALDVRQAELVLNNLQTQKIELERQRAISEHQLAVLTGELQIKVANASLMNMPVPPTPPAGLPSSLLESRPDIQQYEQDMVAANANIGLAKAALYPSISLTGSLGGQSLELSDLIKSAARVWSFGAALNLPIFNSGKLESMVDQATAQQKQALANYQGSIQTAFSEVNDALVNVQDYQAQETVAQTKLKIAKQILEIAQNRYKAGYSGYIDVLDAQRSHQDATQAFVQSRQSVLMATVDLFKALGGGWQQQSAEQMATAPSEKEATVINQEAVNNSGVTK